MIVYHGSHVEILEIDLSKSTPNKDFGRGFYVTKTREQAGKWAARKGEKYGEKGIVSCFRFNENAFLDNDYKTLRFSGYTDEWFEFVVANRNNESVTPVHSYDTVTNAKRLPPRMSVARKFPRLYRFVVVFESVEHDFPQVCETTHVFEEFSGDTQ